MWNYDVACRLGYEEGLENNSLVVMDFEVLLGLGGHGNPQAQQRVNVYILPSCMTGNNVRFFQFLRT